MRILITAGPTREAIDELRFISNRSSGKMGYALARKGRQMGCEVTLVSGPVSLEPPKGVDVVLVESADEMIEQTLKILGNGFDAIISCAAIADYKPVKREGKIRSGQDLTLELSPTRKLVREAKKMFPELFICAFKAEYGISEMELVRTARQWMKASGSGMVIANDVSEPIFGSDETKVIIVTPDGTEHAEGSKKIVASIIFDRLQNFL
ncbi:phosphopantothenoylcysteine decarboxylase [Candidatus Altiarchaeota archaeon]